MCFLHRLGVRLLVVLVFPLQGFVLPLKAFELGVELAVRVSQDLDLGLEGHDLLLVSDDLRLRGSFLLLESSDRLILVLILVENTLNIGLESLHFFL